MKPPVVLLAESDEAMARMCQRFLNSKGYEVALAKTSAECLSQAQQLHPLFAIIDTDGIACQQDGPLNAAFDETPIVLLGTGQPAVPAEAYVAKPFHLAELADAVELADSLAAIPA